MTSVFGKRLGVALNADDHVDFVPERKFLDFSKYHYTLTPKFGRVCKINAVATYQSIEEARPHVLDVIRLLEQKYGRKMYQKYYAPACSNWIMPVKYNEYGMPVKYIRLWLSTAALRTQYSFRPGMLLEFVDENVTDVSLGIPSEKDAENLKAL